MDKNKKNIGKKKSLVNSKLLEACKEALEHLIIDKREAEKDKYKSLYIEKFLQPLINQLEKAITNAEKEIS